MQVAEELRTRVRTELLFTCSCGVAANKTLAKVGGLHGGWVRRQPLRAAGISAAQLRGACCQ
jgi:nucleotidyltransferase/DNA polymerase involved in DNA repair